ncbi:MAG: LLM class flavin-dependent oxidoreductase [Candidatus Dormibacteraeota bacterium]|nr:LLM class flavin-dependent oxidoreductase [Candidatus Dormibacteraeota bacterium]
MHVEFGIWDHFERRPGVPVEEQYRQKIELLCQAERLGFRGYHLAEHHLTSLDLAPSPNVFLAALAQGTTRLRIGSMVHILPLYHPARLVQEVCMLDHLSGGRLDLGIGRGARATEHDWFGIPPSESGRRQEEILKIVVSALSTGNLRYQGEFYQIGDAPLDLLPLQQPHPPLWYAGTPEFPGPRGMNFFGRGAEAVSRYWELWDSAAQHEDGHALGVGAPWVGITKHVVVRRTEEEALAVARRAWPVFARNWAATSLRTPDGRVVPEQPDFDLVVQEGDRLLVGTPSTVTRYLEPVVEGFRDRPTFYFAPAVQWGDITYQEALESLELLAAEVFPTLR